MKAAFSSVLLFLLVACTAITPSAPANAPGDNAGFNDQSQVVTTTDTQQPQDESAIAESLPSIQDSKNGPVVINTGELLIHAPSTWVPYLTIAKCMGDLAPNEICTPDKAYEIVHTQGNNVTTAGANQLWTGLSSTVALPWNTTNTQLAVGDGTGSFSASQTDLQAAAGTKINAADPSGCTNATPVVCSGTFSPAAVAGGDYVFAGFSNTGGTAINNTFEAAAGSASSITLLNTASPGAITVTGATIKPINYYRQIANASGSATVSTNQIVYVATVGTTNGNFTWQEWGMTTGAAATNKQAQAPPTLLNRAVVNLGTKTSASSWTATLTLTLS